MRVPLLLLAAGLVLAGCVAPGGTETPGGILNLVPDDALAFNGKGEAVRAPDGPLAQFVTNALGHKGAEPTMGVSSKGTLFVISGADVMRSEDKGATWTKTSPVANVPASLDPYLHVDVDTGRVFMDHLYVGCSYLAWSDDEGKNWLYDPLACGLPGNDHQTVSTGKPVGVPTVGYPNVVYYGYNGFAGITNVARSLNGGLTFAGATIAIDPAHCGGLNGHIVTDKDGVVYVPSAGCDEPVVAVSRDSGLTWEQHVIDTGGVGRSDPGDDPSLAVDADGNAFLVFPGKDAKMYGSLSTDKGKTWSPVFRVSPPNVQSALMPTSVAGDAGRVAFAYYATTASVEGWKSVNSADAPEDTRWHLFVTYSTDALLGPDATFVTVQVTPDDNPVKIGRIWNGGGDDPDRNLLDFFDMARDADGRIYVAYTDGCNHQCTDQASSRDRETSIATLTMGPSLMASVGALTTP